MASIESVIAREILDSRGNPTVEVEMLLDEDSQHLAGLSDFIGKPISLTAEPMNQTEHYDIVLL